MSRLSNDPEVIGEAQGFLAALGFGTQGTNVVDATAATASNPTAPAALSAANPAAPTAFTAADISATYVEAEVQVLADAIETLRDEVALYELQISALIADNVAARAEVITYEVAISALILDVAEIRTKFNAVLSSLETGGVMASS